MVARSGPKARGSNARSRQAAKKVSKAAAAKRPQKVSKASAAKRPQKARRDALQGLKALVVNLCRRPDRWERCETMLKTETPWLEYERFPASDGSKMVIPENEVCTTWNTQRNAHYAVDYDEWVYDAPGTDIDGTHWRWPKEEPADDDKEWSLEKDDEGSKAVLTNKATMETWNLKLQFAQRYKKPGVDMKMSGGERGCAHSHRRIWEVAANRKAPTLVLEDDAQFVFERSETKLGKYNGKLLKQRLRKAMEEAPKDFDVLYLGWAGWRGGNHWIWKKQDKGKSIRRAEYVYTTVGYVISQKAAKKLLATASPIDQPVDNFMAWEASQGRLKSFVIRDTGDSDDLWAGGIIDQNDFVGDSDVKKSDGAQANIFMSSAGA